MSGGKRMLSLLIQWIFYTKRLKPDRFRYHRVITRVYPICRELMTIWHHQTTSKTIMRIIKLAIVTLSIPFCLVGCSFYSQPADVGQNSPYGMTTGVGALAGAAGGAAAGNAINSDYGGAVGAVAGGAAVGGAMAWFERAQQKEKQAAYAQGKRDGRAMVMDNWWDDDNFILDVGSVKKGPKTRQIPLPSGDYESVPYLSRTYDYMVSPNAK